MFAISAMQFYWIGGTKFSVDPNEAVWFVREEDAARVIPMIQIAHAMSVVNLAQNEAPASVIDLGSATPPSAPMASRVRHQSPQPQLRNDVIGTKTGRYGQVVNIGGQVPGTQSVAWTPGTPVHRLNPRRTGGEPDQMQNNWGKAKGGTVAGLDDDGSVTDRKEFAPGEQVDPLS